MTAFKADIWREFGCFSWPVALRGVALRRNLRVLATLRMCQAAGRRSGPLARPLLVVARLLHRIACSGAVVELPWKTRIGPGLALTHGWGTVVNEDVVIGSNVTLFHGVTLGRRDRIAPDGTRAEGGSPVIEDDVWIGPNAIVIGPVTVGRGSRIGGGTCLIRSVPAHSVVVGNPGRVIRSDAPPDVANPAAV